MKNRMHSALGHRSVWRRRRTILVVALAALGSIVTFADIGGDADTSETELVAWGSSWS